MTEDQRKQALQAEADALKRSKYKYSENGNIIATVSGLEMHRPMRYNGAVPDSEVPAEDATCRILKLPALKSDGPEYEFDGEIYKPTTFAYLFDGSPSQRRAAQIQIRHDIDNYFLNDEQVGSLSSPDIEVMEISKHPNILTLSPWNLKKPKKKHNGWVVIEFTPEMLFRRELGFNKHDFVVIRAIAVVQDPLAQFKLTRKINDWVVNFNRNPGNDLLIADVAPNFSATVGNRLYPEMPKLTFPYDVLIQHKGDIDAAYRARAGLK